MNEPSTVTYATAELLKRTMCDRLFEKTTAAQLPLDGGNERVI